MTSLSSGLLLLAIFLLLGGVAFFIKNKHKTQTLHPCLDFEFLIKEIKIYIQNTYPKILIDYQKIEKLTTKSQLIAEDLLIIEDIVLQFATQKIDMKPSFHISKEQLWNGYEEMSVPLKGKVPKDFLKRKELSFKSYGGCCARCGQKLQMINAMTYLLKNVENGGSYRCENIAIVCSDCNKVLNTQEENISKVISSLHIYDYLITKINH
jgi:hypothetical protein